MSFANVFDSDAFGLISLTNSLLEVPRRPGRIEQLGLFRQVPQSTRVAVVENKAGTLALLPTIPVGGAPTLAEPLTSKARNYSIPQVAHDDTVLAADLAGVRRFGSENEAEGIADVVTERLTWMRWRHDVTHEHMLAGAIQGLVKDVNNLTLADFFTDFSITEKSIDWVLGTAGTELTDKAAEVHRAIRDAIGGIPFSRVHCLAGRDWFDAFKRHTKVKDAYARFQEGGFLRDNPLAPFPIWGIDFEEYDWTVNGTEFIPKGVARFFPMGALGLFATAIAPADFVETVNQLGQTMYAKQEDTKMGRGRLIHTQSNRLPLCTLPAVLIKGTTSD